MPKAARGRGKKMHHLAKSLKTVANAKTKAKKSKGGEQLLHTNPVIPFRGDDRILLVGEGDFSFALSLAMDHGCRSILATSYDAEVQLYEKYPRAKPHINQLRAIDSDFLPPRGLKRKWKDHERESADNADKQQKTNDETDKGPIQLLRPQPKVLFRVDARKLGSALGGGKEVRNGFPQQPISDTDMKAQGHRRQFGREGFTRTEENGGPWDIICFNFPHVGGLSTDVNRQVRANQELLVAFFKTCVPLLSSSPAILKENAPSSDEGGESDTDNSKESTGRGRRRTEPGRVIVTLFEGEPYTLWNIRDLARHAGLRVVTSFKFPWSRYPTYTHTRTLGEIKGRRGGEGGWKGEQRLARTYVFEKRPEMTLELCTRQN